MLPPGERDRRVQEWAGELHALKARRAVARFILSVLLAGVLALIAAILFVPSGAGTAAHPAADRGAQSREPPDPKCHQRPVKPENARKATTAPLSAPLRPGV